MSRNPCSTGIPMFALVLLLLTILIEATLAQETTETTQQQFQVLAAADLSTLTNSVTPASECSNPVRGQCSFYADCLETRYHCGPNGYPIGYGQKYCEKFSVSKSKLSPAGQKWMLDTMECLQRALVPQATESPEASPATTCKSVEEAAFESHARCYLDNGLCTLGFKDWISIVKIIDIKTLVSSWEATKETIEAAGGCLGFYSGLLTSMVL